MRTRSKKLATNGAEVGAKNVLESDSVPPPARNAGLFATIPKGWGLAGDVLDRVRAVETIFPDFNRATRCGGLPLRRITTVHGPTHGGKSAFVGGLVRSFIDAGHIASYVDAEHATDKGFFDSLMGRPVDDIPNFLGKRSTTYEDTIDAVDEFLKWMTSERRGRYGKLPKGKTVLPPSEDLAGLCIVDSINKLVPQRELDRLRKEGGDAIDKGWGRLRAAFNQAFLDHVVPLLGSAETALVIIVQERGDEEDLEHWEMPKLKGGQASQYDASLIVRVLKASQVAQGEGKDKKVYGFKHRLRIWKSKVGGMDGRWSDAHFHMSNGTLVPEGFDLARDAIEVGKAFGVVQGSGGWLSWGKQRWQGENRAVAALSKKPEDLARLMAAVNAAVRKA